MLVIATQQIPDDIETLLAAFKNVPAFVASIIVLGIFWRGHWLWSRRYGLEDGVSIFISWAMIVTMLIYIYPLKAIFSSMVRRSASAIQIVRPLESIAEMQPQLKPDLLRLSAIISRYFTRQCDFYFTSSISLGRHCASKAWWRKFSLSWTRCPNFRGTVF